MGALEEPSRDGETSPLSYFQRLQKLIPAQFRDKYPECAEGRRVEALEAVNTIVPVRTLVLQDFRGRKTIVPLSTRLSQDPRATSVEYDSAVVHIDSTGPGRPDRQQVLSTMVSSHTTIQQEQDRTAGDKTLKTLQFASEIATYWII